ncbi:hypothetical protein Taro_055501 [Colocasia esculenta]|uniref:Secreted protein n=1 Tax=Colocasia esculenta TaxID=4460 RepID=A0A843XR56_COLES|nr:hypothetical protein [Colocasia esculenta]
MFLPFFFFFLSIFFSLGSRARSGTIAALCPRPSLGLLYLQLQPLLEPPQERECHLLPVTCLPRLSLPKEYAMTSRPLLLKMGSVGTTEQLLRIEESSGGKPPGSSVPLLWLKASYLRLPSL